MTNRITIDDVARMVESGFRQTASKSDVEGLAKRLDGVETRLDRIENLLIGGLTNRIERIEDEMRLLKTKAGLR